MITEFCAKQLINNKEMGKEEELKQFLISHGVPEQSFEKHADTFGFIANLDHPQNNLENWRAWSRFSDSILPIRFVVWDGFEFVVGESTLKFTVQVKNPNLAFIKTCAEQFRFEKH